MPKKPNPTLFGYNQQTGPSIASQLADHIGKYIDAPRGSAPGLGNPSHPEDPQYNDYVAGMSKILGVPFSQDSQHDVRQFGETYNPEEYRGIRFLLPESHGKPVEDTFGDTIPNHGAIKQDFINEMVKRGYPLLGGTGQLPGYPEGFNPVGFGQRNIPQSGLRERGFGFK